MLRRVGAAKLRKWKVVAESPSYHVQPYLGMVVQFPLDDDARRSSAVTSSR